jgi:Prolyl oligopeptidase family
MLSTWSGARIAFVNPRKAAFHHVSIAPRTVNIRRDETVRKSQHNNHEDPMPPAPRLARTGAALALSITSLLVACGGGGGTPESSRTPELRPRGTLISATITGDVSTTESDAYLRSHPDERALAGAAAQCSTRVLRLVYATRGPAGEMVEDTAGLRVPTNCPGPFPIVEWNHGTTLQEGFDSSAPNVMAQATTYLSAQGYVTVTPNYSGYAGSSLDYHPYQVAENGAVVSIDAVRAARNWMAANGVAASGKLFLFGSSQGGDVTMATQRAMERDYGSEFVVTANVPTSGSYDLENSVVQQLMDDSGDDPAAVSKTILLTTAYERAYGDIYNSPTEVFQLPWANTVEGLLPGSRDPGALVSAQLMPTHLQGPGGLLTDAWAADFLSNSNNRMRVRLRENETIAWAPKIAMTLCGSSLDPAVAFQNALTAAASFRDRGVTTTVVDVENDPEYRSFIDGRTGDGPLTEAGYHGEVVQSACLSYARLHVFDALR